MKLIILYRPNSEHALSVEKYCEDLKRDFHEINIDILDVDSIEGSEKMKNFGLMSVPVFIVARDDDQIQNIWQGSNLPSKDELAGYLIS